MQELRIIRGSFQGVPNSVAEVQNAAQARLFFVGGNHISFHADGIANDALQSPRIAAKDRFRMPLHKIEQMAIADHTTLERLEQAGAKLAIIKRRQNIRINQDGAGLVERANEVFAAAQ